MTPEQIEEVDQKASELKCSMETAEYIISLEKSIGKLWIKVDELWSDYRQR